MSFDEKLRWIAFWTLDGLRGGKVRTYYEQIRDSYKNGTSITETDQKIRKLISHAVKTTDYYRDFSEDTPLQALPVVNKDTFRGRYDTFVSSVYRDAKDNRVMCTSGSTGTPLSMVQNKDKIDHNTAGGIFLGAAGNYYIGMKQSFIRVWVNNVRKSWLRQTMENSWMMDSSSLSDASIQKMLDTLREKHVKCLIGYSSALGEISRYIEKHPMDMSGFQVCSIIPISESMPTVVRQKLQEQFGCPVRAWYSNEENGIMGIQERDSESYRIDTESYYYEILKLDSDEPAAPGELGRVVITDLYNYAFPILRYDNGDLAVAKRQERNGRFRLYLTELYGRRSDTIYDCDGNALTPYVITNNLWDVKGVKQYRFIQEDETKYTLWLNGDREQMDVDNIRSRILPYFGDRAEITIDFVDEIPVLNSGKRKYIENRCKKYIGGS
ncbi:MAG: phenylacetate--CoA ligase family protein [Blautia sp.]|nr:phenylacetate--CoA ligase family protein [Blautia sp.]